MIVKGGYNMNSKTYVSMWFKDKFGVDITPDSNEFERFWKAWKNDMIVESLQRMGIKDAKP